MFYLFLFSRLSSPAFRLSLVKKDKLVNKFAFIGLTVSALDSGSNGPGSSPALAGALLRCVLIEIHFYSHSTSLHPGVQMGYGKFTAGGTTLRWTSIPSRGELKYSKPLNATETKISSGLMSHLARQQALP